jgi:diketogulonate reductase-like aldo/keto reductase
MKFRSLYNGLEVPIFGFGTWRLGGTMYPDTSQDARIVEVIQSAISIGYNHIDTAEMYGGGHTEELVGLAIRDFNRDQIQIVTKVWHTNLRYHDVFQAFKGSTKRLGIDTIDFFAIHLPSAHIPMAETFRALNELVDRGLVHHLGVSNFTTEQLKIAQQYAKTPIAISQAPCNLYNRKFLKGGLLTHCQQNNILMAAYSPFERGDLLENPVIDEIAHKYGATPAQIALNWISRQPQTMVYLMSLNSDHLKENLGALELELSPEDILLLDELQMPEEKLWPQ